MWITIWEVRSDHPVYLANALESESKKQNWPISVNASSARRFPLQHSTPTYLPAHIHDSMPTPLQPPPEGVYNSKDDLVQQCKDHAMQAGYAMSILKSNTHNKSIVIACVCYGQPANKWKLTEETRQRPNRSSKKTGCKMRCVGKERPNGKWQLTIKEGEHNHSAAPIGTYATHRERTRPVNGKVARERILEDGIRPSVSQDKVEDSQSGERNTSVTSASVDAPNRQKADSDSLQPHSPIAPVDDTRLEAIELARFIKSKGKARPLFELEFGNLTESRRHAPQPAKTKAPTAQRIASNPQRVRQEPGPACRCSKKCDGRCGCRKNSRPCGRDCHTMGLQASIADHGNMVCCGNLRVTLDGKELWPPGWTVIESFVGTDEAEVEELDVDRLWDIYVLDQSPVARVIQEAGGIDAFLVREGYGREFGLLKRARSSTLEAQQSRDEAERDQTRGSEKSRRRWYHSFLGGLDR
jgi:hypothetical protein